MLRFMRAEDLVEGQWRNGQGVSWEIASHTESGAADFSWRFAKARIDQTVPFSIYPGMDRIFMMIAGEGMDLMFEGGRVLQVHEKFVPHQFSCDVPLVCNLLGGPSLDLNLFTVRGQWRAECEVSRVQGKANLKLTCLVAVLYVLEGTCVVNGEILNVGDSVLAENENLLNVDSDDSKLYVGRLSRM